MESPKKPFDADQERDRSPEAGALLFGAISQSNVYGLDEPTRTGPSADKYEKADWCFQRRRDAVSGIRPPGLVYAGARYLSNRGTDDVFVGRYFIIRARKGATGQDEYSIWREGASRPVFGDSLPSYWFYLTVWTDGKDGPVLTWAIVDMCFWAALQHVQVDTDPDRLVAADPKAWVGRVPYDVKHSDGGGTPFYRFPIRALQLVAFG